MLPHSLPASLRSTGGAQDLLSLLHLGASRCPSPCPHWQGAAPGSVPGTSLVWAQHPWPARQCQHRGALFPHCCPCLCLCKLQELSLACHLVWVPWGLTTTTPEAVTRAIQTLVRGSIDLGLHTLQFRCVSPGKVSSPQVWTGWGKTRASSWREKVPPCTQTSPAYVCCPPSKTPPLYELCHCIHL